MVSLTALAECSANTEDALLVEDVTKQCLQSSFIYLQRLYDNREDNVTVLVLVAVPQIVSELASKRSESGFLQQSNPAS